jgi:DNA invertase Pin-like site-specific DNA recombinase
MTRPGYISLKETNRAVVYGAVLWRVSTGEQKKVSPQTQINGALELAREDGIEIPPEYILGTDWHSLSFWDSPDIQKLREVIRSQFIQFLYVYHPDRLPDKPAHRLLLLTLCEENGVTIRCKYGQLPDGEMGEVMHFLDAWAKEKQVKRTQIGARDGLRDRARISGLPVNGHAPYGYRLRYELVHEGQKVKRVPVAYEPDPATYPVACRVWRHGLNATPIRRICMELMQDGIPSPSGNHNWVASTIYEIFRNPIYGGRYYALRREKRPPKDPAKAKGGKTPNTSSIRKTLDEAVELDFPVISPVVTWAEWEAVQKRLFLNKDQSRRNAKHIHLLSRMLYCARDGRRLQTFQPKGKGHYYACSLRQGNAVGMNTCDLSHVNGKNADTLVWDSIVTFLNDPDVFTAEMEKRRGSTSQGRDEIETTIKTLQQRVKKVNDMETELLGLRLRRDGAGEPLVSDEAFHRQSALLRAEKVHYQDEIDRQQTALATLEKRAQAIETLISIRESIAQRLQSLSPLEGRRWALQTLQTYVRFSLIGWRYPLGLMIP